tara:strand:+ start:502 stop:837 length:336 start_codon:yes stop_codon:yes gene_type:complete
MNNLILANGHEITTTNFKLSTIGSNYTEISLKSCTLTPDTTHIKLLEIITPTEIENFLLYQSFKECAVRATKAQLELFVQNISDFTLISRVYFSEITDNPKIYAKYILSNL